jgi:hypothetical protein
LQTCPAQDGISASPLKADIPSAMCNVSYGPEAVVKDARAIG